VPRLVALAAAAFPALPIDARAVAELHRWHRNVLAIKVNGEIAGCFAALFLNAGGEAAMIEGSLPMNRPPPHLLSREGEKVAAVYVWMLVARKCGMRARPLILRWAFERAPGANIYGRPINGGLMRLHSRDGASSLFEGSPIWVLRNSHAASP
ncbi:MAG: hypothetical protein WBW81_07415, partial [Methylocella sp.]